MKELLGRGKAVGKKCRQKKRILEKRSQQVRLGYRAYKKLMRESKKLQLPMSKLLGKLIDNVL